MARPRGRGGHRGGEEEELSRAVGIDAGSTTFKAVVADSGPGLPALLARFVEEADPQIEAQLHRALDHLRQQVGDPLGPIVATGYGRKRIPGAERVLTEITCHARGAFQTIRSAAVLLEVGGQDSKFMRLGSSGEVEEFRMNDKCAAGTGRFLEVMYRRLRVPFAEVARRVRAAPRSIRISSTCTVFAETEVISLVGQGEAVEVILRGLHEAFAERLLSLIGKVPEHLPIWLAGGVALNEAMVETLAGKLGRPLRVVPDPQLSGALGAALAAIR
ncbi:MAG: 2-hydroxyglutaryl-CoA dehydratase [Deltaproteobacteria bacterium]|nr:2-hydroxyglutaryl-CoA dehydratase [Deltaproteobacteria bacterium]